MNLATMRQIMTVERCSRCDRRVDLDWNVDEIEYFNNEPVCCYCWTDEEWERIEENDV